MTRRRTAALAGLTKHGGIEWAQRSTVGASAASEHRARLRDEATGRVIEIPDAGLVLGRCVAGLGRLDDPAVSGQHALLEWDEATLRVVDLGSKNGTLVDGRRTTAQALRDGDLLVLGRSALRVTHPTADAQASASHPRRDRAALRTDAGEAVSGPIQWRKHEPATPPVDAASTDAAPGAGEPSTLQPPYPDEEVDVPGRPHDGTPHGRTELPPAAAEDVSGPIHWR
jgi:hypothetical protein